MSQEVAANNRDERQYQVAKWVERSFGPEVQESVPERIERLYEEVCELAQAEDARGGLVHQVAKALVESWNGGASIHITHNLMVDLQLALEQDRLSTICYQVYRKFPGDISQEVGGISTTLLAYCESRGLSADSCERDELTRILALPPDHFKARQAAKVASGMAVEVPGADAQPKAARPLGDEALREALGAPHCYVVPGRDTANDYGAIDANCCEEGELTRPLWTFEDIARTFAALSAPGSAGPGEPTDSLVEAACIAFYDNDPEEWRARKAGMRLDQISRFITQMRQALRAVTPSPAQEPSTGDAGEAIKKQCAEYGGLPARCLINERNWAPGVTPTRCKLCPDASATDDWREDPSADERWNAGCDYAMTQLCNVLGVDSKSVNWDAATETLDGDIQSVQSRILEIWGGEDWRSQGEVHKILSMTDKEVEDMVRAEGHDPQVMADKLRGEMSATIEMYSRMTRAESAIDLVLDQYFTNAGDMEPKEQLRAIKSVLDISRAARPASK